MNLLIEREGDNMMKDNEKLLHLLDKFIDRSERWIKNAEERMDEKDLYYYKGQKHVIEELKDLAKRWQ